MTLPATLQGPTTLTGSENEVIRHLRSLRYGQVSVQIHDARIVQIERTEKIRVERASEPRNQ